MQRAVGVKELTISWVSLLEAIRRKDIYVMLILSGLIIAITGIFNAFGVEELRKFMVDVSLFIINAFTIIVAVLVTARQLPYEFERRTLYPMLAKPVGRFQFLIGKFLGALAMSTVALLIFFLVAAVVFTGFGIPLRGAFFQAIYFRWMSLFTICSMTLFLSLIVTHAANVTLSLLFCVAASMLARTVVLIHNSLDGWQQKLITGLYWIIPHLDLFDLSRIVVHERPPVPAWAAAAITLYSLMYTAVFLGLAFVNFHRRPL